MPRKPAAATATLDPRGRRLEPPPGLSEAERAAFVAAVRSVKLGHFADEDTPLLTAYALASRAPRNAADRLWMVMAASCPGMPEAIVARRPSSSSSAISFCW